MLNIDTHCHMGGCTLPSFVWKTIQQLKLYHLAESEEDVIRQMTFTKTETRNFHRFLDKFKILDEIKWTESLIEANIKIISENIINNQLDFVWLDLSINKYMNLGWHKHEAIKFIYEAFDKYCYGRIGLILSIKYESMRASQRQYARLIEHENCVKYLMGIDLVGDEGEYDSQHWKPLLSPWIKAGKMVRAHVGEFGSVDNVKSAILDLEVTNIAHGFKIIEDNELIKIALERNIYFDLGLTSNYYTGVVEGIHPILKMIDRGLEITIGTDDPIVCDTTLDKEFEYAENIGVSMADIEMFRHNAIKNTQKFMWK